MSVSASRCPACGADPHPLEPTVTQDAPEGPFGTVLPPRIAGFQVLRVLGRGGMGTVYEAYEESMRRKVALKVLDPGISLSPQSAARFNQEAWIAGRLSHPNIVKVHGQGVVEGVRWIAMELVHGRSLHDHLKDLRAQQGKSSETRPSVRSARIRRVVEWFVDLADGLEHVHRQGIVHRDLKPANMLLVEDGSRLLLTDFGLARDEEASRVTRRGDFIGTVRYMSPEQLLAHRARVDHRSDIWSLGVSLYEALTLSFPFEAASEEAMIAAIGTREPRPARAKDRSIPRDLETILIRCLQRDPERRYPSAGALKEDLLRYLDGRAVLAKRPGALTRIAKLVRRNRWSVVAVGAAAAIVGAVAIVAWTIRAHRLMDQRVTNVLERAIATDRDPADIDRDWPSLRPMLIQRVQGAPRSALALLAQRAAFELYSRMPSFGLLSEPPPFDVQVMSRFHDDLPFIVRSEVEFSWDGAPWQRLFTYAGPLPARSISVAGRGDLNHFLAREALRPGPHRIDYRAHVSIFDREVVAKDNPLLSESVVFTAGEAPPLPRTAMDELIRAQPRFTEIRTLPQEHLHLFESYPEDFPQAVEPTETPGPLETWLRIDAVRLVVLHVPPGGGNHLVFESGGGSSAVSLSGSSPRAGYLLAGAGFEGHLQTPTPIPIAAEGQLQLEGSADLSLDFDLTYADGMHLQPHRFVDGSSGTVQQFDLETRVVSSTMSYQAYRWLSTPVVPSVLKGRLVLDPSRRVALETRRLDHYYGKRIEAELPVKIMVAEASWEKD